MSNRLQQLKAFLADSPDDPFLLFAIAKEHEKTGDTEAALQQYLELKSKAPDYVGMYYHLGKVYEQKEEFKTAFITYTEGMEVARNQGDQHALSELAGARLGLGDEEDFV